MEKVKFAPHIERYITITPKWFHVAIAFSFSFAVSFTLVLSAASLFKK